ncbi:MFS transporter [Paramicrobacterium agarici]|uniref:MFS transporter n=1 Tax=Paramicrobacterium agarici TaxID=630514 RepID=UPI001154AEC0|nr:MFS transporter [Microbacterium agarici]TQO21563.1 putative MFS family arabinose efflux permease [Microbacterium agarici]
MMSEPEAWRGRVRGTPAYRRVLFGLFLAGVATFAQLYAPQAVLPLIAHDLGVSEATSALIISAATLGLAIGVLPWSLVADRVGRVWAMIAAVCGATLVGFAVPFAPTLELMLAGRFVEGLLIGGVPAVAIAYLAEEIVPEHATRAAGTYIAGTTIGGLSGRIISGPVADVLTWQAGIIVVAALCALCAVGFAVLTPQPRGFVPPRLRTQKASSVSVRIRAAISDPRLLALYAQAFLLMGGFVAVYNFLGFRLMSEPFSLPPTIVSLIFLAYLGGTWSSSWAGALAARFGRRAVLVAGVLVMAAGVAATMSEQLVFVLAGLVVMTAGFFAAHSIASGWTGAVATVGRAQASSLYNLSYYAGSSVFGWLGGIFLAGGGWAGTAIMVIALAAVAVIVAAGMLREN